MNLLICACGKSQLNGSPGHFATTGRPVSIMFGSGGHPVSEIGAGESMLFPDAATQASAR